MKINGLRLYQETPGLKVLFRVTKSCLEQTPEGGEHWNSKSKRFKSLEQAKAYIDSGDDEIEVEVFNPVTQRWESLLGFPASIVDQIEEL